MGGPSSKTPATFDLIGMSVAVVEVLSESLGFEGSATAIVHSCGRDETQKAEKRASDVDGIVRGIDN